MNFKSIVVLALTLIAASSQAENPNPIAHPALSLTGGVWLGVTAGGSLAFSANFPIAGGANEDGGFMFSMGPRVTANISNQIFSNYLSRFSNEFMLSSKFDWSFPVGNGFIGPYFDLRFSLELYYATSGGALPGFGASGALGLQHYFTRHLGWQLEFEGGMTAPLIIPFPYGAIRLGFVYAF